MGFSEFMGSIVSFAQNNTVIAIVIALGLLFFMYRKPKLFFGLLILGFFLAGLYYTITQMAGSGSHQKRRMLEKESQSQNSDSSN